MFLSWLNISQNQKVLFVVVQLLSCVWLFVTPEDCSTPGFPVLHYLLEFAQTHAHWISGAILCHPLLLLPSIFPSIRVFSNESVLRIRWLKFWASASVLPINLQGWFLLGLTSLISLLSKELSKVFSSTTIWKHQFFGVLPSLWYKSHIHTWLLEKP